jgi:eukaryotic-like serine/threonine-protein kinase
VNADGIAAARLLGEQHVARRGGGNVGAQLGDGGSAVVFKWEQGDLVRALKVYDPKFLNSDGAPAERHRLELQRRLIGRHCDSMVDTLAVEEDLGTCFLTMEFFPGDELKKVVGKVPDEAVASLAGQLVEAVRFLERFGLVHRDIKPENILVSSDFSQLKLLDLGVVREISAEEERVDATDQGQRRPFIATAQYSSPEYLFRLEAPSPELWKALTLYQIGGVLHALVCKRCLFEKSVAADNKYALAMAVMREAPNFEGASADVAEWAALAARCLTKDSALRLQIVDWPDFEMKEESARDKLKRTLQARAATADRAIVDETRIHAMRRNRADRVGSVVQELRQKLLAEYAPQLRVTELPRHEGRAGVFLTLADEQLGVQLAIEFGWESGVRENFAAVRLAAKATSAHEDAAFSGERRAIGEIDAEGLGKGPLLESLVDATSEILFKHSALVATGSVAEGADLVALTWTK